MRRGKEEVEIIFLKFNEPYLHTDYHKWIDKVIDYAKYLRSKLLIL